MTDSIEVYAMFGDAWKRRRRLHEWIGHPWEDVFSEGLVDTERAEKWALEVHGTRINYLD